jgi:2-polyprenyl-3-methyl-5-hydroxy-6-metoxy-1,4-benzoquinol methylase
MTSKYEHYISQHLGHISRPATVQHNAFAAFEHHGRHFPANKESAILEIGPGFGALIGYLHGRRGYSNIRAVDVSPEVVSACNQVLPGSTMLAEDTADFLRSKPGEFDLVLMLHVLEHIPEEDANSTLEAVRGALKKNGRLIVEVPNIAHPVTGAYIRYRDFTHTIGFTDQSLAFVLRDAGFENVTIYGCRMPRSNPARFIQRTLQDGVELLAGLLLRIYLPSVSVNLATAIGACATK